MRTLPGGCALLSRRALCLGVAGVLGAAALGASGCSAEEEEEESTLPGFGGLNDTEVKTYPVTLKIYADSNLQWMQENASASGYTGNESRLAQDVMWYQSQNYRSDVSFDFAYVDPPELLEMAYAGFPDGDGLIALEDTVAAGCDAGTVDGGAGGYMVRDMGYSLMDGLVMVRAVGSDVELPPARTLTGESTPDGSINQMQELPSFDGLIAIADPATTTEGSVALRVLARQDLFTFDEGSTTTGTFAEGIADKMVPFLDQDEAMDSLASGACQLGFALQSALGNGHQTPRYPQVEFCYSPSGNSIDYKASALAGAPEPGVVRDFFEAIIEKSW